MRNKRGMYINYERSYRKRRGKGRKTGKILLAVLLVLVLGFGAFYVIKMQVDDKRKMNQLSQNEVQEKDRNQTVEPAELIDTNQKEAEVVKEAVNKGVNEPVNEVVEEEDQRIPVQVKGIYVTSAVTGTDKLNELIELVDATEINAMVIDIKDDSGKITYQMDCAMAQEIGATTNSILDIEALIRTLKEHDIYLIARIVAFKDPYLAEQRHDLAIKSKDGSLYRGNKGECWVNPYQKEVWDYLVDISSQAAAIGFDEIQFDYIRFSTEGSISDANFGPEAETKTKEDVIIEFTKYIYEKLKPLGVFVSADVYGTIISSKIDAGLVGQNYVEMSKYLDYICPMIYPSHFGEGNYGVKYPDLEPFEIVRKVLTASKTKLDQIPEGEHRAIVRPWLQDFTASWIKNHMSYGGPELREQIDGVYAVDDQEWLLWNAKCNYSEEGLLKD